MFIFKKTIHFKRKYHKSSNNVIQEMVFKCMFNGEILVLQLAIFYAELLVFAVYTILNVLRHNTFIHHTKNFMIMYVLHAF